MTKGDLKTPIWFNEFTAGGGGDYGTPGRSRMYAYLGLMMGAQGTLAWTFNSHIGGEEQALFGLVDHDDSPSWKVDEFGRIASEFKQLENFGFPRYTHPEVAIAYSFDSWIDSNPNTTSNTTRQFFKPPYTEQVSAAFEPFFRANIDTAIINIGHSDLSHYKDVYKRQALHTSVAQGAKTRFPRDLRSRGDGSDAKQRIMLVLISKALSRCAATAQFRAQ